MMPRRRDQWLSLAERLVLGLVSQEPMHGFKLAALLAPDGEVGMACAATDRSARR